ncbi:MAG: hypothetical protein U0105_12615 [Candidatus Obscuribacterales bacterium]
MRKSIQLSKLRLLVIGIALSFATIVGSSIATSCTSSAFASDGLKPGKAKAPSGIIYTLYPQGDLDVDWKVSRPVRTDKNIILVIPAAFTTHDDKIDGAYISDGVIGNPSVNKELGGAIILQNGKAKLLSTNKGAMLTKEFLADVAKSKGSLFQQFLVVHNGTAATFKDKGKYQRRAFVEFKKGTFGIVESNIDIPFSTFNDDLVWMGAKNALYMDMGAWDEGWYRDAVIKKIGIIGNDRSLTYKQSNWMVYTKKPAADAAASAKPAADAPAKKP